MASSYCRIRQKMPSRTFFIIVGKKGENGEPQEGVKRVDIGDKQHLNREGLCRGHSKSQNRCCQLML